MFSKHSFTLWPYFLSKSFDAIDDIDAEVFPS